MRSYWIHANISGQAKWHLVADRNPGLYFVEEDFAEDEYDISTYRQDFPDNEVVEIPNVHEVKQPLGLCEPHAKLWGRMDCPLCDSLFLYDRLNLAIKIMGDAVEVLSKIPDTSTEEGDLEEDERALGQACIMLDKFLTYARIGGGSKPCSCDEIGESRCPRHGWEDLMQAVREAKGLR